MITAKILATAVVSTAVFFSAAGAATVVMVMPQQECVLPAANKEAQEMQQRDIKNLHGMIPTSRPLKWGQ